MAKPWERYQNSNTGEAPKTGPWSRYQKPDGGESPQEGQLWGGDGPTGTLGRFAAGMNDLISGTVMAPLDITNAAAEALGLEGGLSSDDVQDAVNSRIGGPSSKDDLGMAGAVGAGAGLGLTMLVPFLGAARARGAAAPLTSRLNQADAAEQLGGVVKPVSDELLKSGNPIIRGVGVARRAAGRTGLVKDAPTIVVNNGTRGTGVLNNARRVGEDFVDAAAASPGRVVAAEVAGNTGASVGQELAPEDNPQAQLLATLGGGLAGSSIVGAADGLPRALARVPTIRGGLSVASGAADRLRMAAGMEPKATMGRAGQIINRQATDADRAARNFNSSMASGEDIPVQARLGDEGLDALNRRLRLNDPEFAAQQAAGEEAALGNVARQVRGSAGEGTLEDTGRAARQRMEQFNQNAGQMAQSARERPATLLRTQAPREPEYQNSAQFNQALQRARQEANGEVNQYWRQTDAFRDAPAPAQPVVQAFDELRDDLGYSSRQFGQEMPAALRRILGTPGGRPVNADGTPATTTVGELDSLRRQLSRELRSTSFEQNGTRHYALRRMRDAVYQALDQVEGDGGDVVRRAVGATRELHDRFSRDAIGRILGASGSGGERVQPENVLSTLLPATGNGPRTTAPANLRQRERALGGRAEVAGRALVNGGEGTALNASREVAEVQRQVGDYYYRRMMDAATNNGQLDPARMQRFLETNRDAMQSSSLTQDMYARLVNASDAFQRGDARALRIESIMNQRAPKEARAAQFIDGLPEGSDSDAFLTNLRRMVTTGNTADNIRQLRRQVSRDQTGLAEQGLQNGILNLTLDTIRRQGQPDADALLRILNGSGTSPIERQVGRAINAGLTGQQRDMLRQTAQAMRRIQRGSQGLAADPSAVGGSALERTLRQVISIHAGNLIGNLFTPRNASSGANTSLAAGQQAIGMSRGFLSWLTDSPTEIVLREAFNDPQTMRELLERGSGRYANRVPAKVIGTWMAQSLPPAADMAENEAEQRLGDQPSQ